MAVESMKRHMTDEGWQIAAGLQSAGYVLTGFNFPTPHRSTGIIIDRLNPGILVVQDKREWDVKPGDFREPQAAFKDVHLLNEHPEIFKLTILKDSHQRNQYHRESAQEIGCHAWIVYYNERIVEKLAPFVRPQHLIRTYHTLDKDKVPPYSPSGRRPCILSGAVSGHYPLRKRLVRELRDSPVVDYHLHPGYGRSGCRTPEYLELLSKYKVALCTSSRYGYALRRTFEATACGCVVLTDLPEDEELPEIEDNLVRIHPNTPTADILEIIARESNKYNPERQAELAEKAKRRYDYRFECELLAEKIGAMRRSYES